MPAQVQRDHPVGAGEPGIDREEVEVGAGSPAVQEQYGGIRGLAAGVRTNTSPRPARLITWPGGRHGGTGGSPGLRRSGRASRPAHSTSRLTVGFLASAAIPEAAAAATATVSVRALLIIVLTHFSGRAATDAGSPEAISPRGEEETIDPAHRAMLVYAECLARGDRR